jgi:hypothetical protein
MQLVLRDHFGDDSSRLQASDRGTCMALFEGCMVACVLARSAEKSPPPSKADESERMTIGRKAKRWPIHHASPASKPSLEGRPDTGRLTTAFAAGRFVIVQKE